jgi:hypothetical protein
MKKLNRTAKLAFYTARTRKGDATRIAANTIYSASHIINVIAGRRSVAPDMADEMYRLSRRRVKNSKLVTN